MNFHLFQRTPVSAFDNNGQKKVLAEKYYAYFVESCHRELKNWSAAYIDIWKTFFYFFV